MVAQMVKTLPAMQETRIRSLDWEDSPGEGNGNPLQYSCLENPMEVLAEPAGPAKPSNREGMDSDAMQTPCRAQWLAPHALTTLRATVREVVAEVG